jgi:predicted transposase YdaD
LNTDRWYYRVFQSAPERLPQLSNEEIMVIAGIPMEELRHTRAAQDWLAAGRQEGRQEGEAAVTLRLLNCRCGPLSEATTAQIQALPVDQLEALVDFTGATDLATWLAANAAPPA